MGTISKDKGRLWSSLQVKFSLSYILIMAAVLVLLNTYPILVSEDLVFRAKETSLQNSVSVMVYSLSGLDRLNEENVAQAMAVVEETGLSRILVTDSAGKVLYDTRETNDALGEYSFYTEIVQALLGNDMFSSIDLPVDLIPHGTLYAGIKIFRQRSDSLISYIQQIKLTVRHTRSLPLLYIFPYSTQRFRRAGYQYLRSVR